MTMRSQKAHGCIECGRLMFRDGAVCTVCIDILASLEWFKTHPIRSVP